MKLAGPIIAFVLGGSVATGVMLFSGPRGENDLTDKWVLRSRHLLYGVPALTDNRYQFDMNGDGSADAGVSVLVREGFVVGHCDMMKAPLWVGMQWNRDDWQRSTNSPSYGRPFKPDGELPEYARGDTDYEHSRTQMDRGHMARHRDNSAWGEDNSQAGCLMSNIAPQHKNLNRGPWLALEDAHRSVIADDASGITRLWLITGTIYENAEPVERIGNGIGVPQGLYKIIAWFDRDDVLNVRAYVYRQEASELDPSHFLTTVDIVEALTGIDFFPNLQDDYEAMIESQLHHSMW